MSTPMQSLGTTSQPREPQPTAASNQEDSNASSSSLNNPANARGPSAEHSSARDPIEETWRRIEALVRKIKWRFLIGLPPSTYRAGHGLSVEETYDATVQPQIYRINIIVSGKPLQRINRHRPLYTQTYRVARGRLTAYQRLEKRLRAQIEGEKQAAINQLQHHLDWRGLELVTQPDWQRFNETPHISEYAASILNSSDDPTCAARVRGREFVKYEFVTIPLWGDNICSVALVYVPLTSNNPVMQAIYHMPSYVSIDEAYVSLERRLGFSGFKDRETMRRKLERNLQLGRDDGAAGLFL